MVDFFSFNCVEVSFVSSFMQLINELLKFIVVDQAYLPFSIPAKDLHILGFWDVKLLLLKVLGKSVGE